MQKPEVTHLSDKNTKDAMSQSDSRIPDPARIPDPEFINCVNEEGRILCAKCRTNVTRLAMPCGGCGGKNRTRNIICPNCRERLTIKWGS